MDEDVEAPDDSALWRWVLKLAVGFALLLALVVVAALALRPQTSSATSRSPLAKLADQSGCGQLRVA